VQDRIRDFDGIHNFRDYGGYAARDGARLKSGILWRSGQHVDATPDDLAKLEAIRLATVIDLRGDTERADYPCARPANFAAQILYADGETADGGHAPHVAVARDVITAADAHEAMLRFYPTMPFRPNQIAVYRLYFEALAERDGPSLLHCLAGKDRTGVAAALLHMVMGVHPDDVMADYMLTNSAGNVERRIAAGAKKVRDSFGETMQEDAVRILMSVHPAYLEAALASIRAAHGSVEGYAQDVLGVDMARLAKIEARLLA
jgi:protein tyrosine/serine phosphatase